MTNLQALISARQQQWRQLTAQQRTTKIQRALLDTIDHARKRQRRTKGKRR